MKIIKAFPPNFSAIAKVFPVKGKQGILYAYGDRIYNPSGKTVAPWIIAHEEEHGRQQDELPHNSNMSGPEAWWDLYLREREFRLQQEVLAHQVELQAYISQGMKDWRNYLERLADRLSSPLYDLGLTKAKAKELISHEQV